MTTNMLTLENRVANFLRRELAFNEQKLAAFADRVAKNPVEALESHYGESAAIAAATIRVTRRIQNYITTPILNESTEDRIRLCLREARREALQFMRRETLSTDVTRHAEAATWANFALTFDDDVTR